MDIETSPDSPSAGEETMTEFTAWMNCSFNKESWQMLQTLVVIWIIIVTYLCYICKASGQLLSFQGKHDDDDDDDDDEQLWV